MSRDLTTLAKVKRYTRVKPSDLDMNEEQFDYLIETDLIPDVSLRMVNWSDRNWDYNEGVKEIFSVGSRDRRDVLINGPVVTMTKIEARISKDGTWAEVDSEEYTVVTYDATTKVQGFSIRADTAILRRIGQGPNENRARYAAYGRYGERSYITSKLVRWRARWVKSYESIRVTYTWGYEDVPVEIEMICRRWIALILQERTIKQNKRVGTIRNMQAGSVDPEISVPTDIGKQLKGWQTFRNSAVVI